MTKIECIREDEVLELLRDGRWPAECGDELRAHVASCAVCVDLAVAASAIVEDREHLLAEAEVPGSGLVWWRMQLRVRNEAAREARRTLTVVQVAAVAVAALIAFAILNFMTPGWLASMKDAVTIDYTALQSVAPLVILALVPWLALAPVAAWLAFTASRSSRR